MVIPLLQVVVAVSLLLLAMAAVLAAALVAAALVAAVLVAAVLVALAISEVLLLVLVLALLVEVVPLMIFNANLGIQPILIAQWCQVLRIVLCTALWLRLIEGIRLADLAARLVQLAGMLRDQL